jgi:hypothetical protein
MTEPRVGKEVRVANDTVVVSSKADAWDQIIGLIRTRWDRDAGEFANVADTVIEAIREGRDEVREPPVDRPAYRQLFVENYDTEQYGMLPQLAGRLRLLDELLRFIESLEADIDRAGG